MFTLYHSNQLDILTQLTAILMDQQPLRDPLRPETILVQSSGMAQWLQIALAEQRGVAANLTFPLPSRFMWDMYRCVFPQTPRENAFSKASMSWMLMRQLPTHLTEPAFSVLRDYLQDDDDQRKRYQLAARIADLYDQYMVYRPEWLLAWEKGERVAGLEEAQEWQARLWAGLVDEIQAQQGEVWHRARLHYRFLQTLHHCDTPPAGLPERVFICGITSLPPAYLAALQVLGRHIDIHLLFPNPCRHYWGDSLEPLRLAQESGDAIAVSSPEMPVVALNEMDGEADTLFDTGNPLLASWGKMGRDFLYLLTQQPEIREIDAFVELNADTLLQTLQRDILELEDQSQRGLTPESFAHSEAKRYLDPQDHSVSIHVCHSPQREVEVLHDHLLATLEADPELTVRDIIVMVADIDAYTPFIQAVFGGQPAERYLPYAISDRRARFLHPALQALSHLLMLPDSRFSSEDVLALLEIDTVAARFGIDAHSVGLLRQWVAETGIRWGLDDDNVRELTLPATGQHTWRFGLMRMLLGYAMKSQRGSWRAVLPYDNTRGLIAELAGKLAVLLATLRRWRHTLTQTYTLREWQPLCRALCEDFFAADKETEAVLLLAEQQWQDLIQQGLQAGYDERVPLTLLRDGLLQALDETRVSQRFLAGQINFCTLMPMRSIPFKVVCLLGMNDGVYPRTLTPLGFDLMHSHRQRGDRSRRDEDRYLFLEALLSAQQQLYISYTGRSIQDNSLRYPSVLVSELVDYIAHSFCLPQDRACDVDTSAARVREALHVHHARMPFSAENFQPGTRGQSFAAEWLPAARAEKQPWPEFIQPLPFAEQDELPFGSLLAFWRHPVRAFFQMRLGVSFTLDSPSLPEDEPFVPDALSRYQMNEQLISTLTRRDDPDRLFADLRAAGQLPYGVYGELWWQEQQETVRPLVEKIQQLQQQPEKREIDLTLAALNLRGWLNSLCHEGIVRWRPAVLNYRDALQLWLEHLAACAMGCQGVSWLLGIKNSQWMYAPLAPEQARQQLTRYIEGYRQGLSCPLMLPLESAGAALKVCYDAREDRLKHDEESQAKAHKAWLQRWQGSRQHPGEGDDPYYQRLRRTAGAEDFACILELAEQWLLPALRHDALTRRQVETAAQPTPEQAL